MARRYKVGVWKVAGGQSVGMVLRQGGRVVALTAKFDAPNAALDAAEALEAELVSGRSEEQQS